MSFRAPGVVNLGVLRGREKGYVSVPVTTADVTLTMEQAASEVLVFTGAPTADRTVNFPAGSDLVGIPWVLINQTTGPFNIRVKVTSQTGFVLEKGEQIRVVHNGTDLSKTLPNRLVRRFELSWVAGQRGKPGVNGDILSATEATREAADPDFEILGTNADSTVTTFNAEGGVKLTTKNTSGDQVILLPHLATNISAWKQVTWGTDQETEWEAQIRTGAAVTAEIVWAGLKLTNTPVVATDNDQVFIRYEAGVSGGAWVVHWSVDGTDNNEVTTILVAANTTYHFRIAIDASRIARIYINGLLVETTTALKDATDLIPYVGVQTAAAAAKDITVHGQVISRKFA